MSFWDRWAKFYDIAESLNGRVYREMLSLVTRLTPEGAVVLDTAAGTGQLSLAAAKRARRVVCTDLSLPMLEQARKKAAARGITSIEFEARDILCLADEDDTYDVVMAGNVLHLLDRPEEAVRELYRVTKRGGILLLPTFMLGRKSTALIGIYRRLGFSPASNYTPAEYRRMLRGCGCGEIKTKLIKGLIPCCFAVMRKPE